MQTANVQHLTLGAIVTLLPALLCAAPSSAVAQSAPPSYQGDPDVYKVIFEDENFRVIKSVRKKGEHEKPHSHPLPSVLFSYRLPDPAVHTRRQNDRFDLDGRDGSFGSSHSIALRREYRFGRL